jgi:hypothetical protein
MTRSAVAPFTRLVLVLALAACGGSTKPEASSTPDEGDRRGSRASESGSATPDEDEPAAQAPPRAACDDGTCSPCGDALCPLGWYCDETAPGGPACGWLPECAQKPGCACVKRALAGCSCDEKSGAAHLSCK